MGWFAIPAFLNKALDVVLSSIRGIERSQDKKAGANEVKVGQLEKREEIRREADKTHRDNPTPDNNDDLLRGL